MLARSIKEKVIATVKTIFKARNGRGAELPPKGKRDFARRLVAVVTAVGMASDLIGSRRKAMIRRSLL